MGNKKIKGDALGDRIKGNYENRSKTYLTRRTPVIIRLDGKAFHSFTKNLHKPYDEVFHDAMNDTLEYLCKNIQGCKFGYTQSDEITLVLTDYDTLTTDAWFNYNVQKMCSISASMATLEFNRAFRGYAKPIIRSINECWTCTNEEHKYCTALEKCIDVGAMFDSRCFNVPVEEVTNTLIWRQNDATRNAIQMLGQCHFSHKQLDHKSQNMIQEMLWQEKGINFNDCNTEFKRGICCYRDEEGMWVIDDECPIFSKDREYIEKHIIIKND